MFYIKIFNKKPKMAQNLNDFADKFIKLFKNNQIK